MPPSKDCNFCLQRGQIIRAFRLLSAYAAQAIEPVPQSGQLAEASDFLGS